MSPSAILPEEAVHSNGTTNGTNGSAPATNPNATTDAPVAASEPATILSTRPSDDHHWRITLEDKVIAITGANRGIGLGIAEVCLANAAATVYSLDLYAPGPEFAALQKKLGASRLQYIQCDVTSEESVNAAVETIITQSGAIHGMVANAGMTKHQPALNFSKPQLDDLFNLNVFGAYFCATAAARAFQKLGVKGSIVFTSSMTSYRPNRAAPSAPYGGTKAAVRNMAHTMAMEWASSGIRVNSVSPGFVSKCHLNEMLPYMAILEQRLTYIRRNRNDLLC